MKTFFQELAALCGLLTYSLAAIVLFFFLLGDARADLRVHVYPVAPASAPVIPWRIFQQAIVEGISEECRLNVLTCRKFEIEHVRMELWFAYHEALPLLPLCEFSEQTGYHFDPEGFLKEKCQ